MARRTQPGPGSVPGPGIDDLQETSLDKLNPRKYPKAFVFRGGDHEADLPAQQEQAQGLPRLPEADEHGQRTEGAQAPEGQGPRKPDGVAFTMPRKGTGPFQEIRRTGRRLHGGPWVLIVARAASAPGGRLITALGRGAGSAVTRSRARRVARDCFHRQRGCLAGGDALLLARGDLSRTPRRRLRADLERLFHRVGTPGGGAADA